METVSEIIGTMKAVAPPGQGRLDEKTLRQLRDLTQSLIAVKEGAAEEHARFLSIAERGLCLPEAELADRLRDATILVTGGTGCIGSTLMAQLAARCSGRLVSVSRGVTNDRPRHPRAEYLHADVRDQAAIAELIGDVRPDLLFHVAAQRDPGLAEIEVHRTVSTNVLGTRNVLTAAAAAGVPQVVCASTGKALRPYSPDMYTASKRAAEWVASTVAGASDMLCSAGRFTHVLDNSIIYKRLLGWAREPEDGVIRLHSTEIAFYVQSALESAQLLLLASLGSERGEFRIHAISDLGWPVSLLDLALAVLARSGSPTPVYVSGYDRGYEEIPFPGLYDPLTAGDVSPLLNAFEAGTERGFVVPDGRCLPGRNGAGTEGGEAARRARRGLRPDGGSERGALRAERAFLVAARRQPQCRALPCARCGRRPWRSVTATRWGRITGGCSRPSWITPVRGGLSSSGRTSWFAANRGNRDRTTLSVPDTAWPHHGVWPLD